MEPTTTDGLERELEDLIVLLEAPATPAEALDAAAARCATHLQRLEDLAGSNPTPAAERRTGEVRALRLTALALDAARRAAEADASRGLVLGALRAALVTDPRATRCDLEG